VRQAHGKTQSKDPYTLKPATPSPAFSPHRRLHSITSALDYFRHLTAHPNGFWAAQRFSAAIQALNTPGP
jgi:hypothetical protein